jgi:tripartite-type tricarboxylate transporter receptor subunit TctC
MTIVDTPPLVAQMKAGQLKGLAVTTAGRVASLAEMPTLAEAGLPGYEMALWIGLFAPAGTPRDIAAKLTAEVVRIVHLPDVRDKLAGMGVEPLGNSPEQVTERMKREIAKYGPVVKAAGIKAE